MTKSEDTPINITVVGNSNSILGSCYAKILPEFGDFQIRNASIGANYNNILLEFIARGIHIDSDVIVIETSVIDAHWCRSGLITKDDVRNNLRIALTELRRLTAARIILLVLPIRPLVLEPPPLWIEQHTYDIAEKFGVDTLSGYEIFRYLLPGWQGVPKKAHGVTQRLLASSKLLRGYTAEFLWNTGLSFSETPIPSLARTAFSNDLHITESIHAAIAKLLNIWIRNSPPRGAESVSETSTSAVPLVSHCRQMSERLAMSLRVSSLTSRNYSVLLPDQPAIYEVPPEFQVIGVAVNRSATYGIITLTGADGKNFVADMRFSRQRLPFLVIIYPVTQDIGCGEIVVTIAPGIGVPMRDKNYWDIDDKRDDASAEIGDLILLRRDWNEHVSASEAEIAPKVSVELTKTEWAKEVLQEHFKVAATGSDAATASFSMAVPSVLTNAIATLSQIEGGGDVFPKARLMIAAGDLLGAVRALRAGLASNPEDSVLIDLYRVLTEFLSTMRAISVSTPPETQTHSAPPL